MSTELADIPSLSELERERFSSILEGSQRVFRLSHLFVWTQGELQALVPHEILVFGMSRSTGSRIPFQRLASTRYFREAHFADICRPGTGLMDKLTIAWHNTGEPCIVDPEPSPSLPARAPTEWLEAVRKNEMRNLVGHGLRSGDGRVSSFFAFSRVSAKIDAKLIFRVKLLVPHLHETLSRVLLAESGPALRAARSECRVTDREAEILRWIRDGKTNRDIAEILGLSHFTVKNHIKKITKKMGVANRSHAVARAFSMGIISPNDR